MCKGATTKPYAKDVCMQIPSARVGSGCVVGISVVPSFGGGIGTPPELNIYYYITLGNPDST